MIDADACFESDEAFIDYDFEEVMYRWSKSDKKFYMKFYGERHEQGEANPKGKIFTDALMYGIQISREEYDRGRKSIYHPERNANL